MPGLCQWSQSINIYHFTLYVSTRIDNEKINLKKATLNEKACFTELYVKALSIAAHVNFRQKLINIFLKYQLNFETNYDPSADLCVLVFTQSGILLWLLW